MAAQRFKELRQRLRAAGVPVSEARYRHTRQGPIILDRRCGRAVYRQAKEVLHG